MEFPKTSQPVCVGLIRLKGQIALQGEAIPRWLGIAILLVIATVLGGNHIAARIAFDHGVNITTADALGSSRH
ncbi:MAG: hypothetical protein V1796_06035 [Pseudomonadota bacterium]